MRKPMVVALSLFAALAGASSLSAQKSSVTDDAIAPSRRGFFLSAGLGSGSLGVSCGGCGSDRTNALSGYFRIGGTINPHVRLGFESNGW